MIQFLSGVIIACVLAAAVWIVYRDGVAYDDDD